MSLDPSRPTPKPPKTEYARKLLREFGTSMKLGGAGTLALVLTEAFNSSELVDRLPTWALLSLGLVGLILVAVGNLLTAEAER